MADLVIIDDHPLFLDGLQQFLNAHGHKVISCARSVSEAIDHLQTCKPDALLLDVSMKDGGGLAVLSAIRAAGNNIPAIFLTVNIQPEQTLEALKLGINGIMLKESDPDELLHCIDAVLRGEIRVDPSIMEKALFHTVNSARPRANLDEVLTERERQIAEMIRTGARNRVIAERCGLTEGTVKVHLHSIFRKLGVRSRAELIVSTMPETRQ